MRHFFCSITQTLLTILLRSAICQLLAVKLLFGQSGALLKDFLQNASLFR